MAPEPIHPRRSFAAIALAVAGLAMAVGLLVVLASPAEAQLFERRQRSEGFNPFRIFTPLFQREPREPRDLRGRPAPGEPRPAPVADHSKAPPPKPSNAAPNKRIAVMGASLSDWLAFGLEDIYSDQPDVGIVRKNQLLTGLVRFDSKDDSTWPKVAREFLKDQNPDVIVVMLGLEDRVAIRDRATARDAQPQGDSNQSAIAAPELRRQTTPSLEFRSEQWAEAYAKRIDDMIAVLRSKGVPVIWAGLPAIRGARSTSDMIYLNDLFRARAERAGIIYVDVWDGFVDEAGRFAMFGPDVEGQVRRLRTADGVYLTNAGARKLAHYVDREIKRVMGTKLQPMAIPTLDESGQPTALRPGEPAARPVAGPVVSLTEVAGGNELLGGATRSGVTDPLAVRVLVNGAAVAPQSGRADNFFLTPEAAEAARAAAAVSPPVSAATSVSAVAPAAASAAAPIIAGEPKAGEQGKPDRPARKPAARTADGRTQLPNRPTVQKLRPNTPRDLRAAEPRPPRPRLDPLGLFR